ncbi:transporter [Klebsiella grimontii]|uniref:Transporter n=1 Tax=Klebsiella grimontii TaxID=2058152 RepID=A0A7H4P2U3_9ENTR|nr:transporter [Klebsiella grimontii]
MVATAILSALNVGVQNPTDGSRVVVKNLLSVEGLHWFLPNVIKNFSGFAPLGAILALVLGAGFAERVGLLPSLMVKMSSHVTPVTPAIWCCLSPSSATSPPMPRW